MTKLISIILLLFGIVQQTQAKETKLETVYLAGGCYWGMEHYLQKIPGIVKTEVGFSGGNYPRLVNYTTVSTGRTGYAETVKVTYDPKQVTTRHLLFEFFRLHNPTTKDRQGNDRGTQYRSAIFYTTDEQFKTAEEVIKRVNNSKEWGAPVTTELIKFKDFVLAEESHQDYLKKNPNGYNCHIRHNYNFGEK